MAVRLPVDDRPDVGIEEQSNIFLSQAKLTSFLPQMLSQRLGSLLVTLWFFSL